MTSIELRSVSQSKDSADAMIRAMQVQHKQLVKVNTTGRVKCKLCTELPIFEIQRL